MDAAQNIDGNFVLNFDLLSDNYKLLDATNITGDTSDIPNDIVDLIEKLEQDQKQQNDIEAEQFETDNSKQHFSVVTAKDLDEIASENNAIATHWQTNWSVRVFRGMS